VKTPLEIGTEATDTIQSRTLAGMAEAGHTPLKIAQELAIIAYSDIKNHVTINEGGDMQAIRLEHMGDSSRAVKKIKEQTKITESTDGTRLFKDSRIEYELYDKLDALKFAAALMGMVPNNKTDLTVKGEISALLQEIDGTSIGPPSQRGSDDRG
jgi:hypothetical protein